MGKSLTRNWHGNNVDIILDETVNKRELKYIYALALATKYILGWIERQESRNDDDGKRISQEI